MSLKLISTNKTNLDEVFIYENEIISMFLNNVSISIRFMSCNFITNQIMKEKGVFKDTNFNKCTIVKWYCPIT